MPNAYTTENFGLGGGGNAGFSVQLVEGDVGILADGSTLWHQSDARTAGVSKSFVNFGFQPVASQGSISVDLDFVVPVGFGMDRVYLADFESSNASIGTGPGVRVYLQDGLLRVDRGKIGQDTWIAGHSPIVAGEWNNLRMVVTAGDDGTGHMEIFLNDVLVLQEDGATMISQEVLDPYGLVLTGGELDRVQVGLTANDSPVEAAIATRNINVTVYEPDAGVQVDVAFDPGSAVASTERQIEVLPIEALGNPADPSSSGGTVPLVVEGGAAGDSLDGQASDAIVFGYGGTDTLSGGQGLDTLYGGEGDDMISGGLDADRLVGGGGFDSIFGDHGADSILGGLQGDLLAGGAGDDLVFGESGDDILSGGNGADTVFGGDGNDVLVDKSGADQMFGEAGNDVFIFYDPQLIGGTPDGIDDTLDGGAGEDALLLVLAQGSVDDLIASGQTSQAEVFGYLGLDVSGFEHVDVLIGLDALQDLSNESWFQTAENWGIL